MLSFFIALPYLGVPISVLLSVWVLAFLTGLKVALGLEWRAFWCSALGWAVFQVMQRTIGSCGSNWSLAKEYSRRSQFSNGSQRVEQILETGIQRASGDNRGNQKSALRRASVSKPALKIVKLVGLGLIALFCSLPPVTYVVVGSVYGSGCNLATGH